MNTCIKGNGKKRKIFFWSIWILACFILLCSFSYANNYHYWNQSDSLKWVNVNLSSGTNTFYISNTDTISPNPYLVFTLFDDFDSPNTSKWTYTNEGGSYSYTDSIMTMDKYYIHSVFAYPDNYAVGSRFRIAQAGYINNWGFGAGDTDVMTLIASPTYAARILTNQITCDWSSGTDFNNYEFKRFSGSSVYSKNGMDLCTSGTVSTSSYPFNFYTDITSGNYMYVDYLYVRPLYSTEPSVSCSDNICTVTSPTTLTNYPILLTTDFIGDLSISDTPPSSGQQELNFSYPNSDITTTYYDNNTDCSPTTDFNSTYFEWNTNISRYSLSKIAFCLPSLNLSSDDCSLESPDPNNFSYFDDDYILSYSQYGMIYPVVGLYDENMTLIYQINSTYTVNISLIHRENCSNNITLTPPSNNTVASGNINLILSGDTTLILHILILLTIFITLKIALASTGIYKSMISITGLFMIIYGVLLTTMQTGNPTIALLIKILYSVIMVAGTALIIIGITEWINPKQ